MPTPFSLFFFFFNDTATTEIYTLSLHDALPISATDGKVKPLKSLQWRFQQPKTSNPSGVPQLSPDGRYVAYSRSEEHTSELQSPCNLVCRLLLEKKTTPQLPAQRVAHLAIKIPE